MDDLEEVRQRFTADVEEYVGEVEQAANEARDFAESAKVAKDESDHLRDGLSEAAVAAGIYRDEMGRLREANGRFASSSTAAAIEAGTFAREAAVAGEAAGRMRDKVLEAAMALKITRDENGKLRNSAGEVITAAEAQAMALKRIRDKALEAAFAMRELDKYEKPSLFSRLKGGIGGLLGGGEGEGAGGIAGGLSSLSGIAGIAAAVEGALMVIGPEVIALVTGLSAAGLGVGAFAALAAPALGKVHSAMTQIQADQQAYNRALTSKERATAMAHIKQDWASLDPAQAGAVRGVQQLTGEFQQMAKAFEPVAFRVFNEGLRIASSLMPQLQMFATAVTPAIEGALSGLGRFVTGVDFSQFMAFLQSLAGPVITAAASGLHGLALQVMQMMERFSKKDVINAVNIAFRVLGVTLRALDGLIVMGMKSWDMLTGTLHLVAHGFDDTRHAIASFAHDVAHYFDDFRHDAATAAHDVAHYWDDLRHGVAGLAHDIAAWFDRIRHDIARWADDVVGFFTQLPGRMLRALGNLGTLLWNGGVSLIKGLISGIENAIPGLHSVLSWVTGMIPSWKGPMAADAVMLVQNGAAVMQGFMRGVASQVPALRSQLGGIGAAIPGALGAGGAAGAPAPGGGRVSVTVPLTLTPGTQGYNDPRFLQYLQKVVQEAVLRYRVNNPGNGLDFAVAGGGL